MVEEKSNAEQRKCEELDQAKPEQSFFLFQHQNSATDPPSLGRIYIWIAYGQEIRSWEEGQIWNGIDLRMSVIKPKCTNSQIDKTSKYFPINNNTVLYTLQSQKYNKKQSFLSDL